MKRALALCALLLSACAAPAYESYTVDSRGDVWVTDYNLTRADCAARAAQLGEYCRIQKESK